MKKKILVAAVLIGSVTAVTFASFNNKKKESTEKKAEKKQRTCNRTCPFS